MDYFRAFSVLRALAMKVFSSLKSFMFMNHNWAKEQKNLPQIKIKKLGKFTDYTYACNRLNNFEAYLFTGNGKAQSLEIKFNKLK